jgi:hypothetical protein
VSERGRRRSEGGSSERVKEEKGGREGERGGEGGG